MMGLLELGIADESGADDDVERLRAGAQVFRDSGDPYRAAKLDEQANKLERKQVVDAFRKTRKVDPKHGATQQKSAHARVIPGQPTVTPHRSVAGPLLIALGVGVVAISVGSKGSGSESKTLRLRGR